ncbi:MAG TPA: NAD(+) synthase [Thermoanaerobaculia bacterium]|nr:NAD(+) synthase [Thermoanaerobaculia bacterium]
MRLVKIALGSVPATVGAVDSNTDRVVRMARDMAQRDVTIGCFPEQVLGGYPPEDLIQWRPFLEAQRKALERLAAETQTLSTVFVVGVAVPAGGQLFNTAAVLHRGRVLGLVPKELLPTYGVFYEARTFSRGGAGLLLDADGFALGDRIFQFDFGMLAVEVCEDAWSPDGPMRRRCYSGAEIVVNISASPYRVGVLATRRELLATRSGDNEATFAYVNLVGGQDALVFDGGGFVFQNGRRELEAPRFREGFAACVVDLDRTRRRRMENTTWRRGAEAFLRDSHRVSAIPASETGPDRSRLAYPAPPGGSFFLPPETPPRLSPREEMLDELFEALALGVKDYFEKSGAFRSLGVALSGGRDSLLTLLVAWHSMAMRHPGPDEALRRRLAAESITAFAMPTSFSEPRTRAAAAKICEELGVSLRSVSIQDAFERETEAARAMLGGTEPTPVTQQNIQARLRSLRMWNWANSAGALFLQTSDMSEKAVGYTTVGGDLEGGLAVIANVPKTVVVALLERLFQRFGFEGIRLTLESAPGPELAPHQLAEEELMPFPILDACLDLYAEEKMSVGEIAAALPALFPESEPERLRAFAERFARLFTASIFKWVQAPLALHVGMIDLDRERALQLPVVQRDEWST